MNERVDEKVALIDASDVPKIRYIEFLLFERQNKKTTKLLANSGAVAPIDGQSREYKYSLKEPVFVSHVIVKLSGYKDYDRFTDLLVSSLQR